jgi:hypothetical protein
MLVNVCLWVLLIGIVVLFDVSLSEDSYNRGIWKEIAIRLLWGVYALIIVAYF